MYGWSGEAAARGGAWGGGGGSSIPPTPPRPPQQPPRPEPTPEPPEGPKQPFEIVQATNTVPKGIVIAIGAEALQLGAVIEIRIIDPNQ